MAVSMNIWLAEYNGRVRFAATNRAALMRKIRRVYSSASPTPQPPEEDYVIRKIANCVYT